MSDWSDYQDLVDSGNPSEVASGVNAQGGNTGGTAGGFQMPDWLKGILPPSMGGTGAEGGSNMQFLIPALAQAYQQYNNADQYTNRAEGYANQLDPFGSQRAQYQQQLSDLYKDPSKVENTPGYQFALKQGLGAVNRGDMAKRGVVPNSDDIAFASGLAGQTWNTEANRLSQLAGSQYGPSAAAGMLQTGLTGSIDARNQALQSMFYPFFAGQGAPGTAPGGATTARPPGVTPPPGTFNQPPGGGTPPGRTPSVTYPSSGAVNTNIPDNSVPPEFNPGNSDVPPATEWNSGGDLPGGDYGYDDYIDGWFSQG